MTILGATYAFSSGMGGIANLANHNFSLNYEVGYTFQEGNNFNSYTGIQGAPGDASIGFSVHFPIAGYIHSHPTGTLSVFSGSDLQAIYQIYTSGYMIDPTSFTVGVVTASGTAYTFKIEDLAAFQAFGSGSLTGTGFNAFETLYSQVYGINPSQSNAFNEQRFLQLLENSNSGLALFKGDANNFTNPWNRLKLNATQQPVPVPCP